jgi:xylulokinase
LWTERSAHYCLWRIPYQINGVFLGLVLTAGGSLKWLRDTLFADKKRELQKADQDVYKYMDGLASASPEGCEGLTFLPYLNGEKTPYSDRKCKGSILWPFVQTYDP